jgi:hypothetical protein
MLHVSFVILCHAGQGGSRQGSMEIVSLIVVTAN